MPSEQQAVVWLALAGGLVTIVIFGAVAYWLATERAGDVPATRVPGDDGTSNTPYSE